MKVVQTKKKTPNFSKNRKNIFELMLCGLTASEIADALELDARFVCKERHAILKALGLTNELQLIARALEMALIDNTKLKLENLTYRRMLAA